MNGRNILSAHHPAFLFSDVLTPDYGLKDRQTIPTYRLGV